MEITQVIALCFALAFTAEGTVEYLFGIIQEEYEALIRFAWVSKYLALIVGIGLAFAYNTDLISYITESEPTTVGVVVTGVAIGRGSNFLNQFVSTYLNKS
jgi:hypothetical protein